MDKLAVIRKQRAAAHDEFVALAEADTHTTEQATRFKALETEIQGFDEQIVRVTKAREMAGVTATPVAGQDISKKTFAQVKADKYETDKSLVVGGICKMLGMAGNAYGAKAAAIEVYGESHPVTKALAVGTGSAGGFIVPPEYANEIIELLRPRAVIRAQTPRVIPMPRGTMTMPGQASPATASYSGENKPITASQQTFNQIVAQAHKLTALVPISNDMMRYADPAVDAVVRDDLVKVIALREDLAFLTGDGTQGSPRGYLSFANGYAVNQGGTAGSFNTSSNSVAAVGGNWITSNATVSQVNTNNELAGLINKLDTANVPEDRRAWFFHSRIFNYLYSLLNSYGQYVYRDEMEKGKLMGYPFGKSNQLPINIQSPSGTAGTTFVMLAEMTETMVFDAMQLELAVSREGTYVDASGSTQSAFQNDQTLIRAITEHDFQMRHDAAVAIDQFVQWAPALS
jgi:HK97 family phage major capsid protein